MFSNTAPAVLRESCLPWADDRTRHTYSSSSTARIFDQRTTARHRGRQQAARPRGTIRGDVEPDRQVPAIAAVRWHRGPEKVAGRVVRGLVWPRASRGRGPLVTHQPPAGRAAICHPIDSGVAGSSHSNSCGRAHQLDRLGPAPLGALFQLVGCAVDGPASGPASGPQHASPERILL